MASPKCRVVGRQHQRLGKIRIVVAFVFKASIHIVYIFEWVCVVQQGRMIQENEDLLEQVVRYLLVIRGAELILRFVGVRVSDHVAATQRDEEGLGWQDKQTIVN